ncbi:MAG: response regulator transcription factor [Fimbriimonadaceae bacterium]|nr:response regulator transcription factor [Fimbriimonadaceae bacterium]
MSSIIRTVVVDDEAPYRNALQKTLGLMPECELLSVCADGMEALEFCLQNPPDVLLTDINMPRMNGIELIKALLKQEKTVRVVILTVNEDDDTIFDAIAAGALGYLLKTSTPQEVIDAIRAAEQGGARLTPKVATKIIRAFPPRDNRLKGDEAEFYVLSPREEEILDLMAKGLRNKEIADQLFIAEKTVKNHVSSILDKLQVNSRTEAVIKQLDRKAPSA